MTSCKHLFAVFSLATLCLDSAFFVLAADVSFIGGNLLINGVPRIILSGSIHYPRSTAQMWPDLIQKAKQGGLDTIETYIFWDLHEPQRRKYSFSGNLDFVKFFKTVQDAGMNAIIRIGPYVCAEWNYGGFPVWLHRLPGIQLRTDNKVFKDEMQNFTTLIVNKCKEEKLFASQGGPILLSQIENEYGNFARDYGQAGKSYIRWCANMAESLNTGVPWIMCQQPDAPQPIINTCNGFYCDTFQPNRPRSPKMWTENWTGWYKNWGGGNPHRTAEDVAFAVARFFQAGGVLQNYYMYHGGTNFGRTAGGPYVTTSYDYDAPLDEYGNLVQPKWGHLKKLHEALKSAEEVLTQKSTTEKDLENGVTLTQYTDKASGGSICFLSNTNVSSDFQINLHDSGNFFLPAWSVSVLTDCKNEVYNTAKVYAQTSIMVKKSSESGDEPDTLSWSWKSEPMKDTLNGLGGTSNSTRLLEQKAATADASDYLWYMTSINVPMDDLLIEAQKTLLVKTSGHVLHVYVNGALIGSKWGRDGKYDFTVQSKIMLKLGRNYITLLSATVGLGNYGAFFDMVPAGIVGGPVQLIGSKGVNDTNDLSSNLWFYKVGLNGEKRKFYDTKSRFQGNWEQESIPINRPMTWYKKPFLAPLGTDPVVVDLKGMGKGHAWVNGHSIGRFWPSFVAREKTVCGDTCNYRGIYKSSRCLSNCGNPTQRWYHIPRSFLFEENTLVLFEEIGGNPSQVNFQTVTVGTVCANVLEGFTMELSCQGGGSITDIEFASFGDPRGTCQSFKKGTCEAPDSLFVVQKACIGEESCSINVSNSTFEPMLCDHNIHKRLAVQAVC